ncbi:dynamin family protein [Parageobacillus thermoglucosidasius]|uniref:Dynamin n=1 Tax=Parageobacillus thermoglucosidasius TaxID=1426 RepID=A0A1B7KRQ7_PARTM|nr:dynamin family protein [Parageobacillus thermoglucosidasius]OAT72777.1 dynamin [Parageobacillus thermoglucosidasius]
MGSVTQQTSLTPWLKKMIDVHDMFIAHGDEANAKKAKQLLEKTANEQLAIAFCGHFSAGKSSMINALLGEPLLPSSPIPTSANLVKVKSGQEYIRVFYKHEPPAEYEPPYDPELIRAQCKDGDAIEFIEVSRQTSSIPNGIVIMDTPGIDSTDDAHRLATESALHLADVVFYMMDYNHVQAELNFQFTKKLTSYGKTLYLVINQIDKHRDKELSFHEFRRSVEEAFQTWGVKAERIFFTSLKAANHPHNEWNELVKCFQQLFHTKDERLLHGVEISLKRLVDEHARWLAEKDAEEEAAIRARLAALGSDETEKEQIRKRLSRMQEERKQLEAIHINLEAEFRQELDSLLENAYIMPFETRELAKAYLQSMQPDFKVGFLFAKAKTAQERENRLQAFYKNVKEKAVSQIEWHVRELLIRFLKAHGIEDYTLLSRCQQWMVDWEADVLSGLVKKGAGAAGEAVLHYADDVAYELKKRYRNAAMQLFGQLFSKWQEQAEEKRRRLEDDIALESEKYEWIQRIDRLQKARKQAHEQLMCLLASDRVFEEGDDKRLAALTAPPAMRKRKHSSLTAPSKQIHEKKHPRVQEQALSRGEPARKTLPKTAECLRKAAKIVAGFDWMNRFVRELTEKAERLEHRTFTVALFGAFSAGKSSFANALIGERVLPSSPNPTTATINKIVPPTEECPHGTVIVQVKSNKQLFSDVQASLRHFRMKAETWDEALAACEKIADMQANAAHEKPHYSFLQAVLSGIERMKGDLGRKLRIGLDEFAKYVAEETTACFIESVELYYDCALTRRGITLVDTPGADSINARHTDVAFEYIKNADAVLFVTYYNHAFSKADREFLIQLGRVKDTFALDKMFFIVNAADLAHSPEELNAVLAYVEEQLAQFGIRFPRLYALSSRFALDEKTGRKADEGYGFLTESGIRRFEEDFARFISEELVEVAIQGAYAEMKRAHQTLLDYINAAQQSNEEKAAKQRALSQEQAAIRKLLDSVAIIDHDVHAMKQEIAELVYYVKQRVSFRFHDWFKESFNPAALRDDVRDIRQALRTCLEELLHSVGFDLAQEMRATSLRIERFLKERFHEQFVDLCGKIERIHKGVPLSPLESISFPTPEFPHGFTQIDEARFSKALSMYKNAKSFFERDEKRYMKEEMEKQIQGPISDYAAEQEQRMFQFYNEQYGAAVQKLALFLLQQVDDYFSGLQATLSAEVDIEQLHHCERRLASLLEEQQ